MLQGINLEEVKQYNATLKQYRDRAASLNAEIEYTNKELDALCAELTAELGKPVTRDNIEQIYNEQVASIQSTLQSGTAVLSKIASEEQNAANASQPVAQTVSTPVAPQPMNIGQAPVVGQVQVNTVPVGATPVAPQPIQGNIFNGQASVLPGQQTPGTLPTLFNI